MEMHRDYHHMEATLTTYRWENTVNTIDYTVREIKFTVKYRILQILSSKVKENDRSWLENL